MANEAFPQGRICSACEADGSWRCLTCTGCPVLCLNCCHQSHRLQPFHRVQSWSGSFFQPAWLYQAGLKLYFGHGGARCPAAPIDHLFDSRVPDADAGDLLEGDLFYGGSSFAAMGGDHMDPTSKFTEEDFSSTADFQASDTDPCWKTRHNVNGEPFLIVIDQTGMHLLPAIWCQCGHQASEDLQALDLCLFPASSVSNRTMFTFDCLDDFLADNQECNTTAYQYCEKLRRSTNPYFPDTVPVGKLSSNILPLIKSFKLS